MAYRAAGNLFFRRRDAEDRAGSDPITPLYTHADPAEVERLRAVIEQQKNLIESLRAELVESQSIDASAEPSAPAETSQLLQELDDLYVSGEAPSADVEDDHDRYLDDNATTARFLLLNLDRIRAALAPRQ